MHLIILMKTWTFITAHFIAPETCKSSSRPIYAIFKKGDKNKLSNYRGIWFCNTIGKIFTDLLLYKLETWFDNPKILKEFQAGFCKTYSTIDNIFNPASIIKIKSNIKRQKSSRSKAVLKDEKVSTTCQHPLIELLTSKKNWYKV